MMIVEPADRVEIVLTRPCPSCRVHAPIRTGCIHSGVRAEDCSFEDLQRRWYGFFRDKLFFTYCRCSNCGLLYAPVYFSREQLDRLYESMPANMAEVSHKALDRTQRGYFEHLRSRCTLSGEFLEIGPDVGTFAQYCVEAGNFAKAWMFEPNVDAHAEIARRLSKVPTRISTSLLDLSEIPDGVITVAAMIHVLDHLTDPVDFLKRLIPKLAPNATLMMVTHDERSTLAKLLGKRWPAYCLQHPHLFNPESMLTTLRRAGFRDSETVPSTNYFPINFLAKQALLAVGIDAGDRFSTLPKFELALKLGNIITIARV